MIPTWLDAVVNCPCPGRRVLRGMICALILVSACGIARAAQDYTVDLVVFTQSGDGEQWVEPGSVYIPDDPLLAGAITTAELNEQAFEEPTARHLADAADQLDRATGYRVVLHEAWNQVTDSMDKTAKYRIEQSVGDNQLLTGYLHVFLTGVYLQVDINLTMVDFSKPREFRYSPVPTYRIDEVRRVKLNELHYMDHPRIGALVHVARAQSE